MTSNKRVNEAEDGVVVVTKVTEVYLIVLHVGGTYSATFIAV